MYELLSRYIFYVCPYLFLMLEGNYLQGYQKLDLTMVDFLQCCNKIIFKKSKIQLPFPHITFNSADDKVLTNNKITKGSTNGEGKI